MDGNWSRRSLLKVAAAIPLVRLGKFSEEANMPEVRMAKPGVSDTSSLVADGFPTQPAELVREMVTVAHFDLKRVKELVEARASLAKASWDWGFGDWETALGAASH